MTRKELTIVATLDAQIRDCNVRLGEARRLGDGPECAIIGREKAVAKRLRRQIGVIVGAPPTPAAVLAESGAR
jgi:hypothetical protein